MNNVTYVPETDDTFSHIKRSDKKPTEVKRGLEAGGMSVVELNRIMNAKAHGYDEEPTPVNKSLHKRRQTEMKKDIKWLKEKLKTMIDQEYRCYDPLIQQRKQTCRVIMDLIDQLDEPKKVVIPQFVADWIDAHNLHGNNPLREYRDLEIDFNEGWTDEEDAAVYHWVNENPYTFIDALRYGYEVEKEKLYHVVNKENYFLLRKYDGLVDILHALTAMSRDKYGKDTRFMLTEQEIKNYDERFWVFAEEVTE